MATSINVKKTKTNAASSLKRAKRTQKQQNPGDYLLDLRPIRRKGRTTPLAYAVDSDLSVSRVTNREMLYARFFMQMAGGGPNSADASYAQSAHAHADVTEDMFDASPDLRASAVHGLLVAGQRTSPISFFVDAQTDTLVLLPD